MTTSLTDFAGLEVLGPGDALSADGFRFQAINPVVIDYLLHLGAKTHKHDGKAGLAQPTAPIVLAQKATGGSIPGGTTVYAAYTLIDSQGGETLASEPVSIVTPPKYPDPGAAPTAAVSNAAGVLLANNYDYALTVTDGAGGETVLGPSVSVVVLPGFAHAEVTLSDLNAILKEVAGEAVGAEWRLWRSQAGGPWDLLAHGTATEFTDDGTASPDCNVSPPLTSTVKGTNEVTATVPEILGEFPEAQFFRLYLSTDGAFLSPSLVGQFPAAEGGAPRTFKELALTAGAPPLKSLSIGHAAKIDPDTDLLDWHWKRPVAKHAELPGAENEVGDMRLVLETHELWEWAEPGEWLLAHQLKSHTSETIDLSQAGAITAGVKPGSFRRSFIGETQQLVGLEAELAVGKCSITLLVNGAPLASVTAVALEAGVLFAFDLPEPLALANKDRVDLEVVTPEGAETLALSLFVEHISLGQP